MRRHLYFPLTLLITGLVIIFSTNYLYKLVNVQLEWIEPILAFLGMLFWLDYFNVKDNKKGLWQIVSYSNKAKFSLILHIVIFTFVIGWISQHETISKYRFVILLVLFLVGSFSFFITSPPEIRIAIKKNYSERE